MNPAFLIPSALLFIMSAAEATSWHTLLTSAQMTLQADDPQAEAIDSEATGKEKKKDRKLKIWDKITYSQPPQAKPGDFYYASAKSLTEINCTARTLKPLQKIYYDSDGNEIKSVRYGASERNEGVTPDTPGEFLFKFACNYKTATANTKAPPRPAPQPQPETRPPATKQEASKDKSSETQKTTADVDNKKTTDKPVSTEPKTKPVATKKSAG